MGSNNNKNQQQQPQQNQWGNDPRGTSMKQIESQTNRFNQQQGPMVNQMAMNYGRGSEANYGDYTDIMNQYRNIASGQDAGNYDTGGGGGGGGGYSAFTVDPERVTAERVSARQLNPIERVNARSIGSNIERVKASDPYSSYAGFQDFSQTGGYSPQDIANMRARGMSPIRAAYANAERGIGQQRSLQGGYSPNAIAAQVKMAREQGQSMADAGQNVEAGIAEDRNRGRLSGLQGMSGIEQARQQAQMQGDIFNAGQYNQAQQFDVGNELEAGKFNSAQALQGNQFDIGNDLDASKFNSTQGLNAGQFNANLNFEGQKYNADANARAQAQNNAAGAAAASSRAQANAQNMDDRFRALSGMQSLYGATPGMANTFGNQLLQGVNMGGSFGLGAMNATNQAGGQTGAFDQGMGRLNAGLDIANTAGNIAYPWLNDRNQNQGGYTGAPMNIPQGPTTFGGGYASPSVVPSQTQRRGLMGGTTFGGR